MNENENENAKTFTQEEMESYADKRVNDAMRKAKSKFENEKKEAERLASMSAEERFTEEMNKREAELAEREKQVALLENKAEATKILAEKGIAANLVDLVLADDAETIKKNIDLLEKEFNASVQKEIEKRLTGTTPKKSENHNGVSKEDFRKMTLAEQQNLYNTNPSLYKALSN